MPQTRLAIREDAVVLALLVLLLTAVYFDVILLENNFFTRDLTLYHYPMKKVVRDTILTGQSPLWNPMFGGGQPMAANPAYEVFYPPQWLTLLPDYNLGFRLHILLHAYLAAIGAFFFLRSRGTRQSVAFLGGIAFVLGGPFVSAFNLLPFMFSVAWVPWIALFAARFFETRTRRDLAMLVFFVGLQALICEPTTLLQTWFVLGAWGAWHGWHRVPRARLVAATKGFLTAVGIVIAGLAVAAVQFLPALDFARDTVRGNGLPWITVSQWSFPPIRLIEFVFPNFLGTFVSGGAMFWGRSLYEHGVEAYFASVYIGLPFVALGLAGVFMRKRGAGFVVAIFAVSAVLAMGSWTPLLRLLYDANLLPSIRYPEKFLLMGAFVALAWGCLVLEDLLAGDRKAARATVIALVASGVAAAGVFAWTFHSSYDEWFMKFWPGTGGAVAFVSKIPWLVAAGRGLAFAFAIEFARRTQSRAATALLVMVMVADLGPLGNQVNPRMPRRFFDAPRLVTELAAAPADTRLLHLAWLEPESLQKIPGGFRSSWVVRNGLVPTLPSLWGTPTILELDVDETQLTHTREFMMHAIPSMARAGEIRWHDETVRQVARICNVGVIARRNERAPDLHSDEIDWSTMDLEFFEPAVLELVDGAPRYYFATEAVLIDGVREMFEMLVRHRYPAAVAFVDGRDAPVSAGIVHSVEETNGRADLDVEALGDALLVASVTRHRYWSATLDGKPVELRAVNHAFQGIEVPPGRHQVRLRYENPLVPAGAAVTLTMLAGLVVGARKRRRL